MKRRGFTLIELLVVIAIIAILAAILFPVFATAKERGRQSTCCSNLKQLATAFFSYADDNDGYLPISQRRRMIGLAGGDPIEWTGSAWSSTGRDYPVDVRQGSLWKGGYVRNVGVFNCPSDKDMPCFYGNPPNATKIAWSNSASFPPGVTVKPAGLPDGFGVTYSVNEDLCDKSTAPYVIKLATSVAGRSGQVMLMQHEQRGANNGRIQGQNDGFDQWWSWTSTDEPGAIHWDGTTCSYADGHVRWISNKEIKKICPAGHESAHTVGKPCPFHSPWHRNSYFYNGSVD